MKPRGWAVSWGLPLGLFVLAILLIRPWGEYPLNDDWQYAWVAKHLAETGRFIMDVAIAPSLVGQSLLAAPFISVFGFSHLLLRLITLGVAIIALVAFERILAIAGLRPLSRGLATATLAMNPLFVGLSASFMTDIYGLAASLVAAWIWFAGRARAERRAGGGAITWPAAIACAAVAAAGFWTRQTSAWVFPSLLAATAVALRFRGQGSRARAWPTVAPGLVASALLGALVLAYFPWARAHRALNQEFTSPLGRLLRFHGVEFARDWVALAIYGSIFTLPALWALPFRRLVVRKDIARMVGLALFLVAGAFYFHLAAGAVPWPSDYIHRKFPLLGNYIYSAGIGPITLSDVYIEHVGLAGPSWPGAISWIVYAIAGLAALIWVPMLGRLRDEARRMAPLRLEIVVFSLVFAIGGAAIVFQAFATGALFDRYLLPPTLGLLFVGFIGLEEFGWKGNRAKTALIVALGILPLSVFSIGGVHDYFRWNDSRWAAVSDLRKAGVRVDQLDGGYEVNGWLTHLMGTELPDWCVGYYLRPKPYRIVMTTRPGYRVLKTYLVDGWLGAIPPLKLETSIPDGAPRY